MSSELSQQIRNNPKYRELTTSRNKLGWFLTILMLIVYYGFIIIIAFDKKLNLFATPLAEGMITTIGIPVGFGVIVFTILITGIYVYYANTRYDALTESLLKEVKK